MVKLIFTGLQNFNVTACYLRFFAVNDDMQKSRFWKESSVASHKICFFIYFKSTLKQIWKSPCACVHSKTIPWKFEFLIRRILELFTRKICIFFKKVGYFLNVLSIKNALLKMRLSRTKKCYNVKLSTYLSCEDEYIFKFVLVYL